MRDLVQTRGDKTFLILNGPLRFSLNLADRPGIRRFFESSQTLSPLLNGLKLRKVRSFMAMAAIACAASASALSVVRLASR